MPPWVKYDWAKEKVCHKNLLKNVGQTQCYKVMKTAFNTVRILKVFNIKVLLDLIKGFKF